MPTFWSQTLVPTLREVPGEAEAPSHRLMLRAGLIRQLGSGAYSYLPLGYRSLRKAMQIIREEMDAIGCAEVFLPSLQPIELWERTGRRTDYGDNLFVVKDRHQREQGPRPDPRGSRHRPALPLRRVLPRPAQERLPDPDQVPRRVPPPLRRPPLPRVPDEGRLLLPPPPRRRPRKRLARRNLREAVRPPTAASSTAATSPTKSSKPSPAPSAAPPPTSSWSPAPPAKTPSSPTTPATPRTSKKPRSANGKSATPSGNLSHAKPPSRQATRRMDRRAASLRERVRPSCRRSTPPIAPGSRACATSSSGS